jgi:hypothetical protein
MDNGMNKQSFNPDAPAELEFDYGPDATGYWFAALVMFAALAAGVIVYRAANYDTVVALNDPPPAAATLADPIAPPPLIR